MALKYSSISSSGGTGFNVQLGSKYSYAQFTQAQPSGAYTIKSSNNYTNWDVYLLDANNNLVAYTGTASIAPTSSFSAIVVVNGTVNDILQFSFQSTVFSTAETAYTNAGPFITAATPTSLPNQNNTITVTGGNFASGITATFTGSDLVQRTAKAVIYNSATSLTITRPDSMPVAYAPYTLTLGNPGINNPSTSAANILTGLTVGSAPSWTTGASLPTASSGTAYSTTVVATDPDGAVTYSYVSGSLPSGISFNSGTGVISGTYSGYSDGTASYTIRATDTGGNYIDRTFTIGYTGIGGGLLASDTTYYYRVFTSNSTLSIPGTLPFTMDVLTLAGGGSGGAQVGGGGGAGGLVYNSAQSLSAGNYTITVGAGASVTTGQNTGGTAGNKGLQGANSTFTNGTTVTFTATGGGGGSGYTNQAGPNGGSGGGADGAGVTNYGAGIAGQGNRGGQGVSGAWAGGGGGGAGAVGGDAGSNIGGNGGSGTNAYASWLTACASVMSGVTNWTTATSGGYIAGGGGGCNTSSGTGRVGAGGAGGGASGASNDTYGGTAVINTGSGGGGSRDQLPPTAGSSGIVIVRYTRASVGG